MIRNRSKLDAAYQIKQEQRSHEMTTGVCEVLEPILCLYIDLDGLIERCGLSAQQMDIVLLIMAGYTVGDIAEIWGKPHQQVVLQYQRAVQKITRQNDIEWYAMHKTR